MLRRIGLPANISPPVSPQKGGALVTNDKGQHNGQPSDSAAEIQRLFGLVDQLQRECEELRKRLAQVEKERDGYLKSVYELTRKVGVGKGFQNMDVKDFEAMSAGPVELL
jgi:hypothetical protein